MCSQAIRSPLPSWPSSRVLSAMLLNALWLSEMAMAYPNTPTSTDTTPSRIIRRATTSRRPTATGTGDANASTGRKGLSLVVIIIIVVAVVVAILAIAGTAYWLYRGRSKAPKTKTKALNLPPTGQPSSRPISSAAARREPDWWQPSTADGVETVDSHDHTVVPYSQGGHGYTYGRTLEVPASTLAGTRISVGHQSVGHGHPSQVTQVTEQDTGSGRPFQIPVLAHRPPPSISPSYHTYAGQGERSLSNPRDLDTIRSGHVYNPEPYTGTYAAPITNPYTAPITDPYNAPTNLPQLPPNSNSNSFLPPPPSGFQPRPAETTLAYLQPQATGTSIYSNPYETSAMTQSTSGHPGT